MNLVYLVPYQMYYSIVILKHFWSVNIKVTSTWLSHCPH